ncbi:unnamed protein product [marine sediment metagenome]|uniref:Uncharacterized protein n=1 Tax=marine sediment metagenome TaxID=412755 RepID=X0ZRQ6_9ZZZZ
MDKKLLDNLEKDLENAESDTEQLIDAISEKKPLKEISQKADIILRSLWKYQYIDLRQIKTCALCGFDKSLFTDETNDTVLCIDCLRETLNNVESVTK